MNNNNYSVNTTSDATTVTRLYLNHIDRSLTNQTQIINDVSYMVGDASQQLGKLIPVAWLTLALFLLRLCHLIYLATRKVPKKVNSVIEDVFKNDLRGDAIQDSVV